MKPIRSKLCVPAVTLLLVLAVCLTHPLASAQTASAPTSRAATATASAPGGQTQPAVSADSPDKLRKAALEEAIDGRFDEALRTFHYVRKLAPDDQVASAAIKLLNDHITFRKRDDAQRDNEFNDAVQRVKRSLFVLEHQAQLAKNGLDKKLREKVLDMALAYTRMGKAEALETASEDKAAELKEKAAKAQGSSAAALAEATALLKNDSGEYAQTFRKLAGTLSERLQEYGKAWASADVTTEESREEAAKKLTGLEEKLVDAIDDVETMVAEEPWVVAVGQARLARELAVDGDKAMQQDWYRQVVAKVEEIGKKATADGDWSKALNAYAGLEVLDQDNEQYKDMVKTTQRHVRVLRLYGKAIKDMVAAAGPDGPGRLAPTLAMKQDLKKPATAPSSAPSTAPAEEAMDWHDLVAGVDAEMVKNVIVQIDEHYVDEVDYRKVTRGALMSLKVLTETPEAAASFPDLQDKEKRQAFIEAINGQLDNVASRDRVDHLDLQLALYSLLRASDRTVQIPLEVLCVEFTDGLLDELDKFSSMVWPYDLVDFDKSTMGHFVGVGIQITKERIGEPLKVATPLADSPAFKAGIKPGDLIIAVDGKGTERLGVDKLVKMIMGEKGTKVTLTISRAGKPEPFDVTLIRENITIRTIKGWDRVDEGDWSYLVDPKDKLGYIRLTQFTDQTPKDLDDALKALKAAGVRSLVLDMRFNPGGLLRAATRVADEFLAGGEKIVSTLGRKNTQATEAKAEPGGEFQEGHLVVLVNQYSASAAEIVSGAVKDWKRGLIIGERTYGKGSVQNVISIRPNRAELRLTTAYYYLPSGRCLHRKNGDKSWGVDPDVKSLVTPKQTRRWLDIRRKIDLQQEVGGRDLREELAEEYDSDIQLNTAVLVLKLMQLQDVQPMVAEPISKS